MDRDYRDVIGQIDTPRGPRGVRRLRRGLTTGSCAQAAAAAAARLLCVDAPPAIGPEEQFVEITLPRGKKPWSGRSIAVPVAGLSLVDGVATATVVKDAGDDEDVTDGASIVAKVSRRDDSRIVIRGGAGVGVVTRPGLPVPVGEAAINPVPRRMIRHELERIGEGKGFDVEICVPAGEEIAGKTWNPRIGVVGGISIIGTNGVVEPASSEAFQETVRRTARAFRKQGVDSVVVTLGYVGEAFLKQVGVADEQVLVVGDHIGFALDTCVGMGFESIAVVGHIGKLSKVAAGLFDTHSKYGDARLETLAAHAGALGATPDLIEQILGLSLAEQAVSLLREHALDGVFVRIARRASERSERRCAHEIPYVLLDLEANELARWPVDHRFDRASAAHGTDR